jgi:hypothetical protein
VNFAFTNICLGFWKGAPAFGSLHGTEAANDRRPGGLYAFDE